MDFDQHAEHYQAAVEKAAGISVESLAGEKARLILRLLAKRLGNPKRLRVLDVGGGIGLIDREIESEVANLCAVDVSIKSLEFAIRRLSATRLVHYDGKRLPFADASFDGVFASCVLHHVPPAIRTDFIADMLRSLRDGGVAIVIEHNPLNPVTRHIVSRCVFDADAILLTCGETAKLLAAGGARHVGRHYFGFSPFRHTLVERAERALGWLPVGAQYCVWGIKNVAG